MARARSWFLLSLPWLLVPALHTARAAAEPEAQSTSGESPSHPGTPDRSGEGEGSEESGAPETEASEPAAPAEGANAGENEATVEAPVSAPPHAAPPLPPTPPPARAPIPVRALSPEAEDANAAAPKAQSGLLFELDGGVNRRFGSSSLGRERKFGGAYSLGLFAELGERVAIGLELQHTELGGGVSKGGLDFVVQDFSVETGWLTGRFIPVRTKTALGFLALRAGLAVQHVSANGARQEAGTSLEPARGFVCSKFDGPDLALGAGIGARFGLGPGFAFITRLDGSLHRLSSGPICALGVGAGSSTSGTASVGLAYGL